MSALPPCRFFSLTSFAFLDAFTLTGVPFSLGMSCVQTSTLGSQVPVSTGVGTSGLGSTTGLGAQVSYEPCHRPKPKTKVNIRDTESSTTPDG